MKIVDRKGRQYRKSVKQSIINEQILTKQDFKLRDVAVHGIQMHDCNHKPNKYIHFINKIKQLQINQHLNRCQQQQAMKSDTLFQNTAIKRRLQSLKNDNNNTHFANFGYNSTNKRFSPHKEQKNKIPSFRDFTIKQKTLQKFYSQEIQQQNLTLKQLSQRYRHTLQKYVSVLSTKNTMVSTFYSSNTPKFNQYHKLKGVSCDNSKDNFSIHLSSNLMGTFSKDRQNRDKNKSDITKYSKSDSINQERSQSQPLERELCQILIKKPKIKICFSYKNQKQKQMNLKTQHSKQKNTLSTLKSMKDVFIMPESIQLERPFRLLQIDTFQ